MAPRQSISRYRERDVCTTLITPAILAAGFNPDQFCEEVRLAASRVTVRGNKATRLEGCFEEGGPKFADCVLCAKSQTPLRVSEAKENKNPIGHGLQQGIGYTARLDAPFTATNHRILETSERKSQ